MNAGGVAFKPNSVLCWLVRSPPLRSPTSGRAPRRRLITPIPGQRLFHPPLLQETRSLLIHHMGNEKRRKLSSSAKTGQLCEAELQGQKLLHDREPPC